MVVNTLPKSIISVVRKVHLLQIPTGNSQSPVIVCTNVVRACNLSQPCGNITVSSPVKSFQCTHFNYSHQPSLPSWISVKSAICRQVTRSYRKFSPQRFSQKVNYCRNSRKDVFSKYIYFLRPKNWLSGKVRIGRIILGSIFVVPPIFISKDEEKVAITELYKEPEKKKEKERGKLLKLLLSVCEFLQLCLRALRLILTFGPILVLYPATYCGKTVTDIWWSLLLRAIEFSGPILIKLGQWASTRRDIFPDACCSQFSHLQRRIKPHSWSYTLYQLRKAFGPHWKKVFIKFDNDGNPIGSGCVAQVYKVWMSTEAISDDSLVEEILSDMDDDSPSLYEGLEVMGFGRLYNLRNTMEWDQDHVLKEWQKLQNQRKAQKRKEELEREKELQLAQQAVLEVEMHRESEEDSAEEQPLHSLVEEWQEGDFDKSLPMDEAPPDDLEGLVPVAIKVLHPGVQYAFRRDLRIMRACAWFITVIFPSLEWLSLPQCVDEFAEVMASQIDLKTEAEHLEMFSENFADVPVVKFPRPLRPYVTKKVLVETYEEGEPMINLMRTSGDDAPDELKKRLAEIGVDALLKMVFVDNLIHGDLHPGNILVQNNSNGQEGADTRTGDVVRIMMVDVGYDTFVMDVQPDPNPLRICILDCGIVSKLSEQNLANIKAVFKQIVLGDGESVADLFLKNSEHQCVDPQAFRAEINELVQTARHNTISLGQVDVGVLLQQVLGILLHHHVRLESAFSSVVLAIFVLEGLGRTLDPNMDILERARPMLVTGEVV